jgi:hypothetical protein
VAKFKLVLYRINTITHVKWVPCHNGMVRPLTADGGDGLQTCRAAANIMNKQSRADDNGWSFSLKVGRRAN